MQLALIAPAIQSAICTLEDGHDYNGAYARFGASTVPNITCYIHDRDCADPVVMDQLAHAYGEMSLGSESPDSNNCGYFTDTQSILDSKKDYRYYCRRNTTVKSFGIRFNEYNSHDNGRTYPFFTDRSITALSEPCNEYQDLSWKPATVGNPSTDDENYISAIDHTYAINATSNGSILIPTSAHGRDGTTYIYRGDLRPKDAVQYGHGARGLWMWVYRNMGSNQKALFYECPVTVGLVANVVDPAHNISDDVAREAVASIALQGQWHGQFQNPSWTQWQWYASG